MNYPEQIEEVNREINDINSRIQNHRDDLQVFDDTIVKAVLAAIDEDRKPKYTNDKAREIAINESRRESTGYRAMLIRLRNLESEKAIELATLERLRGEFRESLIEKLAAKASFAAEIV